MSFNSPKVKTRPVSVSPYWLGVSSVYFATSVVIEPFSAGLSSVMQFPVGLFLLFAVRDYIGIDIKKAKHLVPRFKRLFLNMQKILVLILSPRARLLRKEPLLHATGFSRLESSIISSIVQPLRSGIRPFRDLSRISLPRESWIFSVRGWRMKIKEALRSRTAS